MVAIADGASVRNTKCCGGEAPHLPPVACDVGIWLRYFTVDIILNIGTIRHTRGSCAPCDEALAVR
jgi:hypothetical protein